MEVEAEVEVEADDVEVPLQASRPKISNSRAQHPTSPTSTSTFISSLFLSSLV